jgi:protein O-GlcNAc transferase
MAFAVVIRDLVETGEHNRARELCRERLAQDRYDVNALTGLATIELIDGKHQEAMANLKTAARAQPQSAGVRASLGSTCLIAGKCKAALRHLSRARLLSGDPHAYTSELHTACRAWASQCYKQGRLTAAARALQSAVRIKHDDAHSWSDLGSLYGSMGSHRRSGACFERAVALRPDEAMFRRNLAVHYLYRSNVSPDQIREAHVRLFGGAVVQAPKYANTPIHDRVLRIGYYSADFRFRAGGSFLLSLLREHAATEFVIICFSATHYPDEYTASMRGYAHKWNEVSEMTDSQLAATVANEQIDILIDTTGHFDGGRPGLFALNPAPIQLHMIGYPATTGMPGIRYRITDYHADPPGLTEHLHTEELVRLPETFVCYTPNPGAPEVAELPDRAPGHITFGCFQRREKITPAMLSLWAKILCALPAARLVFHHTVDRGDRPPAEYRSSFEKLFARRGVSLDRIEWLGPRPYKEYLQAMSSVDVALDTFPYNGTTTTCEALYMGVPVVTLAGTSHLSRVGLSCLTNLALSDWVAHSPAEYVAIAVRAAHSIPQIRQLRRCLRGRLLDSSLTDARRYTRAVEGELKRLWRNWCDLHYDGV